MSCCGAFAMPIDLPAAQSPPQRPFEVSGRMVLFAMVAFFAVVAGVNAVMMTVAIRTMPGVDVKSAYETSQRFNGEIARMQAQTERGWRAQARVSARERRCRDLDPARAGRCARHRPVGRGEAAAPGIAAGGSSSGPRRDRSRNLRRDRDLRPSRRVDPRCGGPARERNAVRVAQPRDAGGLTRW